MRCASSTRTRTPTGRPSSPATAARRASSSSRSMWAWWASTCRSRYRSRTTASAAGRPRSSATCTCTVPRGCSSTPVPRWSPRAGPILRPPRSTSASRAPARPLDSRGMSSERGAPERFLTTVVMTDIVGSTEHAAELGDQGWRDLVQLHHAAIRAALRRYRGREIDTAGDGFFAIFDAPAAAVDCVLVAAQQVHTLGIEIRAGVHVGEVEQAGAKVTGITLPISSRIMALAGPGEVLVSATVRDLAAGSGLTFDDRGSHELKGVPGEWHVYAVGRPASKDDAPVAASGRER